MMIASKDCAGLTLNKKRTSICLIVARIKAGDSQGDPTEVFNSCFNL